MSMMDERTALKVLLGKLRLRETELIGQSLAKKADTAARAPPSPPGRVLDKRGEPCRRR